MIWPCDANKGILEDVCLQSIANYPEMLCVNQYFECLERQGVELSHKLSKAKVSRYDCVLIATDHTSVNYTLIKNSAKLIYDLRNVYKNFNSKKIKVF